MVLDEVDDVRSALVDLVDAFDLDTGDLFGQVALPGNASGSPMTYMVASRQYIAVPVGNRRSGPELVVLALPF